MRNKQNRQLRKTKRNKFQFELLEPRQMFSVSPGLTIEEILARRQDMLVKHQVDPQVIDTSTPTEPQSAPEVDNFAFSPIVSVNGNMSAVTSTPLQLGADVFVITNFDLSVRWTKISGPGNVTFSDPSKIDTTVQFDQPGTYHLQFVATNKGLDTPAIVTVNVTGALETDPIAPELFDTTYSLPTGGKTHRPANGTEFQAALNTAQPGDVIVLQAGTTYTGNFSLPKKEGDGWIYIISSELDQLPVGSRVGLDDAGHMPKLVAADEQLPVIRTEFGSHHYRLAGIEVSTAAVKNDLIRTGMGIPPGKSVWGMEWADTEEELPHNITFDRMLIHSTSETNKLRHGIMLNGHYMAVVDSYIANVKDTSDAQAIYTFNGGSHYKIVNNFLEATGENYMAGGADPKISGAVPSDIEFRGNYLFKRLEWNAGDASYNGINWGIKNLLELKNAQRVLITGNVMENSWTDGQNGTGVLFTVRNQSGSAPWSVIQDINFENNIVKNVGAGIAITGEDDIQASEQTQRVRIHDNLFENVTSDYSVGPTFVVISTPDRPILNLSISHNTFLSALGEDAPKGHIAFKSDRVNVDGFVLKDNIMVHGSYQPDWSKVANADIANNVLIMLPDNARYLVNKANFNSWHPGWLMADPGFGAVGFVDFANGKYGLGANSPFKNAATDGGAVGANVTALQQLINSISMTLEVDGAKGDLTAEMPWGLGPFSIDSSIGDEKRPNGESADPRPWQFEISVDTALERASLENAGDSPTVPTETLRTFDDEIGQEVQASEIDELFEVLEQRFGI